MKVCLFKSFLLKWDVKRDGCIFRMSPLLGVSNAKAPGKKIVYPNQHQLCLRLCGKTPCSKVHVRVLVFPIPLAAGFSILLLRLIMPQVAFTFFLLDFA